MSNQLKSGLRKSNKKVNVKSIKSKFMKTEQTQIINELKINKRETNTKLSNIVIDRKREWFQPEKNKFDFNKNYEDWYLVTTLCFDNTKKLSPLKQNLLVEFVKYSKENFTDYKNDGNKEDVIEGVRRIWNSLPFTGYVPPYRVSVLSCEPLKEVFRKKRVRKLMNEPLKVINHSTMNSLELMTEEISKWKMNFMWKGYVPNFYKD